MGFNSDVKSKAASGSADDTSWVLKFLPDSALSLISPLPSCDQEVLAYLVTLVPRIQAAGAVSSEALVGKSARKPWHNAASPAASKSKGGADDGRRSPTSLQYADHCLSLMTSQFAEMSLIREETGRKASLPATHKPTFGCDCFCCYSNFWGRWNTSPNGDVIDRVLDLFDRYFDDSGHKLLSPPGSLSSEGRKRQVKKQSLHKEFLGTKELGCGIGELVLPKRGIHEITEAGNGDFESVVGETILGASSASAEAKTGNAEVVEKEAQSSSLLRSSLPTKNALLGVAADRSLSRNEFQGKNSPRQRGGKRKSKQVTPLDCEGSLAVKEEEEAAPREESANTSLRPIALRVEDLNLRGRGFFDRVFPGALGGVATRLWDLVSLRLRSHTVNFY